MPLCKSGALRNLPFYSFSLSFAMQPDDSRSMILIEDSKGTQTAANPSLGIWPGIVAGQTCNVPTVSGNGTLNRARGLRQTLSMGAANTSLGSRKDVARHPG